MYSAMSYGETADAVLFEFSHSTSADAAYATLLELGYKPVRNGSGQLHIHLNRGDLTSALEIAMAHGGYLLDQVGIREDAMFCSAYDTDAIPIPAHIVNEDMADVPYGTDTSGAAQDLSMTGADGEPGNEFLPQHDDYGFFSGDVRA
jgi:hypothetical protein